MNPDSAQVEDLRTDGGHEFFLVRPRGEPTGPGVLYLHWFDEAPDANRSQFLAEAEHLAAHGVVSVLPQLTFPWHQAPTNIDADRDRIIAEVGYLEEVWSRLAGEAGVDGSRLAVVGHDFGAMYGTLLLRETVARCAVLIAATPRWADWFVRFWPISTDRHEYMRRMSELDPITAVAESEVPALLQFGDRDFYIAVMTALELVEAAAGPKTLLRYDAGHAMDLDEIRDDRLAFLAEHLGLDL